METVRDKINKLPKRIKKVMLIDKNLLFLGMFNIDDAINQYGDSVYRSTYAETYSRIAMIINNTK